MPFGAPPVEVSQEFRQLDLAWLAAASRAAQDGALCIRDGRMEWGSFEDDGFRLQPRQLVPVTAGPEAPAAEQPEAYEVLVGTLNVQGFGTKAAYLEAQLDDLNFNVVMFQETKSSVGMLRTKRYLRLATASQSKWGTAVWIHRRKGLFSSDTGPAIVDENDIDVVEETPRLLVLKVSVMNAIVYLIAAHCPHDACNQDWRGFLASLETHLLRAKRADLVILGIDANGRVPGHVEGTTGPVECGTPDPIGKRLTAALAQARMWLPATYRHLHPGGDTTFVHPTGSEHRIDYIALGGISLCLQVRSLV